MANVVEIILRGIDQTAKGFTTPINSLVTLEKAARSASLAIIGLGTTGVASLAALTVHAINSADELGKMAQRTNIPVEALSRLAHAADTQSVASETLEKSIRGLGKAMVEALANPASESRRAFDAVGVAVVDANGKLRATDQVLLDLADRFSGYQDSAAKAALAQQLFGKSGADLLPLLNQSAEGIRKLGEEIQGVTPEMARQADEFNDNLSLLKTRFAEMGVTVAKEVLPHLLAFTNRMIELEGETGTFSGVAQFAIATLKTLAAGLHFIYTAFEILGKIIGATAGVLAEVWTTRVTAAISVGKAWFEATKKNIDILVNLARTAGEAADVIDRVNRLDFKGAGILIQKMATEAKGGLIEWGSTLLGFTEQTLTTAKIVGDKESAMAKAVFADTVAGIKKDWADLENFTGALFPAFDPESVPEPIIPPDREAMKDAPIVFNEEQLAKQADAYAKARQLQDAFIIDSMTGYDKQRAMIDDKFQDEINKINALPISEQRAGQLRVNAEQARLQKIKELNQSNLVVISGIFGNLAAVSQAFGKKGFAAYKVFASAQALVSAYLGASKALAEVPYPLNFVAAAAVLAAGLANVATINATQAAGAAHGGIDFVPDERTFLLSRGERVLSPPQNQDFTEAMENGGIGGRGNMAVSIHIDGAEIGRTISQLSRDGRLEIHMGSLVT